MSRYTPLFWAFILIGLFATGCQEEKPEETTKYPYETVEGDPMGTRIYTLDNGLKVYLSVNEKEPRIQTYVAVRAGSKNDPAETTGLAHYLEHMMFKGTHTISTTNWEAESVLLDNISALFEKHKNEQDPAKKKEIYAQIDSLSYEASKYALPNEYDKMVSSIGAKGTNAYTWVDQTVYVNDIPANELEKWLMVESERFQTLVLRLFHTELETVYEEFNRAYDNDSRKSWKALTEGVFPTHPYGTQTTIGEGEHLKNPSMVNIHNYFNKYYVPNNIAICLAGDLDPDKTIELIDKHFGSWEKKPLEEWTFEKMPPIDGPVIKEVSGVQPEHLYMGFRLDGANSNDILMAELLDGVLSNGQAGLIDLDLVQKQRVLSASSFVVDMHDYTMYGFYAEPKQDQTLEELKDLMLAQIDSVKQGNFDDWLLDAVVKNKKLNEIKSFERNSSRASKMVDAFIQHQDWESVVSKYDRMDKITKDELVKWVNSKFADNYVAVYKRNGEPTGQEKVEKPKITAIDINREGQSPFKTKFDSVASERLTPQFVDYQKEISTGTVSGKLPFSYIKNEENELFDLTYILDMGSDNDKMISLAASYLPYLGTDKYTAAQLQQEFFKLGLNFDVRSGSDRITISLSGLSESLEEGIQLFEHILANIQPDEQAYKDMVDRMLKKREDNKKEKGYILWVGMFNYAKYGKNSSFTDILSEEQLKNTKPEQLVDIIKGLTGYKHRIFYYGPQPQDEIATVLEKQHPVAAELKDYPAEKKYTELETNKNIVYVVNYDMVQAEIMMVSKGPVYNPATSTYSSLFNEYFGSGLSSIVFQEIRESKALAYSAFSAYSTPRKKDEAHYVYAYVGTQADKLPDATQAMLDLMNDMPEAVDQYKNAKDAAMKKIESDRTTGASIFWSYESAKKRGLDYDINKDVYAALPGVELSDLKKFFNDNVKDRNFTFLVLGNKKDLDMNALKKLGEVKELTLEEIFNY